MEPSQPNTLCTVSASGGPTSSGKLDEEEMMLMLDVNMLTKLVFDKHCNYSSIILLTAGRTRRKRCSVAGNGTITTKYFAYSFSFRWTN